MYLPADVDRSVFKSYCIISNCHLLAHIYFTSRILLLNSNQQKKIIDHHALFREIDDLPPWRSPVAKKKPQTFNARSLITREIVRSRDAQCNTGK